jgi:hypothetical protein
MTVTYEQAFAQMSETTNLAVQATIAEMRAAAYLIALATRESHPTATTVHLQPSDQGDWLAIDGWSTATGQMQEDYELDEGSGGAASHLYLPRIGSEPDEGVVPGLWQASERPERYTLDIDRVLREYVPPVVVEALTVRDPDGPTDLELTVLGVRPQPGSVRHFTVDAGAGWEWRNWTEHRDSAFAHASDAMLPLLREAFGSPPGGKYVEERPEGSGWLDAAPLDEDEDVDGTES